MSLFLIFGAIAFLYSMGGFAGGSSYLLVLTADGATPSEARATALFCNLAVSAITFTLFSRAGHFRARIALPFTAAAVPAAFLGAQISLPKEIFLVLIGICLLAASLRIFLDKAEYKVEPPASLENIAATALPLGALIGFVSGIAGVGGGVFLCPSLIFLRWASVKEASAAASFFILANSLSGLWGQAQKGFTLHPDFMSLAAAAALGGFFGAVLGARKFSPAWAQRILASVLFLVSIQILTSLL